MQAAQGRRAAATTTAKASRRRRRYLIAPHFVPWSRHGGTSIWVQVRRARAEYCGVDEAIALSPVPVEESDVQTSFGTTHVLTAGDPSKPPLVALHGAAISSTMWLPLLPALTVSHHVRMLDAIGDMNKSVATRPVRRRASSSGSTRSSMRSASSAVRWWPHRRVAGWRRTMRWPEWSASSGWQWSAPPAS